jgi:hypothetical protein
LRFAFLAILHVGTVLLLPVFSSAEESSPEKYGLDFMARAEQAARFDLGSSSFTRENDEGRLLLRIRPSVAATPSENLSVLVEGQWYAFYGDSDFSLLSLYQGYAEEVLPGENRVSFRAGRQEFVYGSAFLLGSDAFYDGLAFDAVKLAWTRPREISVDLFGGRYVKKWAGNTEGTLYGIYAVCPLRESLSIDLYGFRDTGAPGSVHVGGEHEVAYSAGGRLVGKTAGKVSYELEPVYQFGRKSRDGVSHYGIRAFGGHADIALDLTLGRRPGKVFLSYAYGSGDGDPQEGKSTEFRNPNNDSPLVGGMNVVGDLSGLTVADPAGNEVRASGLHGVTARVESDVTEKINVSLAGHYFRADKVPAGCGKEIGVETNLIFACKWNKSVSTLLSVNRFFTGEFFRGAAGSGKDIDYAYAQLQATF